VLLRRRLGAASVQDLHELLLPALSIVWVDKELHSAATSAMLAAIRRDVSLVDWVSFEVMRRLGIETAFAFDRDFRRHGFATIP
jgi:predicted nucleic acid-binding protein